MKRALALLLGTLACVGCGSDYSETDISAVVTSFSGADANGTDTINEGHITIVEGHIVKAHIDVFNDDNEKMKVLLKTDNAGVVDVKYVINPNDFAFFGNSVGHCEIQVIADDILRLTINATVIAQPSPE